MTIVKILGCNIGLTAIFKNQVNWIIILANKNDVKELICLENKY